MKKLLTVLSLSSLFVLNGCSPTTSATKIPELGVSVELPSGYTVQTVNEDDWEIHRVFNGDSGFVDIETIQNYSVDPTALISADAIKSMLEDSEGIELSEMNRDESDYGATLLGETPDSYYVFGGVYKDDTHEAVCQLHPTEDLLTEDNAQLAFEICASLKPLEE